MAKKDDDDGPAGCIVILIFLALLGVWRYFSLGWEQEALARQGIHMSKWDIMMLKPKMRVMQDGKAQIDNDQ